jgi:DNA primase
MRYSPNLLDEILRRTDIVQLVGRKVKLTRRGQAFWGCCPFHKEKSASFKVENTRRTYKCFGCGKGGDAFKWLAETEGLTFPESVEKLAAEAGVELPQWSPEDEAREEKKKSLYDVIEAGAAFFEESLRGPRGHEARHYLQSRGLDGAAAKRFRLGYAPSGNGLIEHFKGKNITIDDTIAAGLARPADETRGVRDFFFDRLMFPITDHRGRIIAFGGRGLTADAKPKYINTGETALFSKGHMLYNFAEARKAAIKSGTIILCEGYMDVIALVTAGFEAAVAPLGTALTEDQLQLLWRTAPEPIVTFDGDEAGLKAAHRAAHLALPALKPGFSLRFAFLPPKDDPDSLIRSAGAAAMQEILDKAEPLSQVLWRVETEGKDFSTPERRAGLERQLAEIVGLIGDGKIAEYYRRDFEDRVFQAFKRRAAAPRAGQNQGQNNGVARSRKGGGRFGGPPQPFIPVTPAVKNSLLARTGKAGARKIKEEEICRLLLEEPEIVQNQAEMLATLAFSDPQLDSLRRELLNLAASGFGLESGTLNDHLVRLGMSGLLARLQSRGHETQPDTSHDLNGEARFLRAAGQLREITEFEPERARAALRLKTEASEENEREFLRLRKNFPGD